MYVSELKKESWMFRREPLHVFEKIWFDRGRTWVGVKKDSKRKYFPLWNVDMLDDMEVNTKVNKVVNHLLLT